MNINELELVIEEKNLGSLKTNAEKIKEEVEIMLNDFDIEYYTEENVEEASKSKATLNKMAKALNDERIKIEKEFNKPFEEFKTVVTDTCKMIKEVSGKLDEVVKIVKEKSEKERYDIIHTLFLANIGDLKDILTLDRVFIPQWLNKGSFNVKNEFKLESELIEKLDKIRKELLVISEMKSKYEVTLKNMYLENFDLGAVIIKNNELIASEEKLATQEVESYEKIEEVKKQKEEQKLEEMSNKKIYDIEDEIETFTLKITATVSKMKALKNFLEINEMEFEKVEL